MANFDVYDGSGKKVVSDKPSPVKVAGLTPNTSYAGYKIAYTGAEEMADVPTTKTKDIISNAPTVSLEAGDGTLAVTLTKGTNLGSAVSKYTVYWSDSAGKTGTVDLKTSLTGSITGLTNGAEYTVQATATNGACESNKSTGVKATPVAPVETTP